MAKHHIPESHGAHPNVTPLIDVVMVLIVFFMLVAKIGVNTGADKKIVIPASILGVDLKGDMGSILYLNVAPGQMEQPMVTALVPNPKTGSQEITELKIQDAAGQNQLVNTLKFFRWGRDLKKGGTAENADNDNFQVVIRGDKGMQFHYLEHVLQACAVANVKAVNFNTAKVVEKLPAVAQN